MARQTLETALARLRATQEAARAEAEAIIAERAGEPAPAGPAEEEQEQGSQ